MDGKNGNGKNGNGSVRSESDNGSVGSDTEFEQTKGAPPGSPVEGPPIGQAQVGETTEENTTNQSNTTPPSNTTKPSNSKGAEGENETFTDLTKMGSVQTLEGLSVKIVQQTNLIEKYNNVLTENLTKLQNDAKEAVETAQTKVTKIKGLEKDAVQAIDSALKGVYSTIDGSINGLKKQVENYRHTLDPSGNILPKSGPTDESENVGVKPQKRTLREKAMRATRAVFGSRGGYKSTPRTRKHRKTYRFTATPKSQTMKKRHRTHKKAKKQAKKQNKQRK